MNILFVDDEPMLLSGLKRSLRSLRADHSLFFVDSGEKALEHMAQLPVDLIVSDMRMPKMNGVELLTEVKKLNPCTIRFVLSGYSDKEMINASVGLAHQYFVKPCEPSVIKDAIMEIESLGAMLNSEGLRRMISEINYLPPLPETYTKITLALKAPDCDLNSVADLIRTDVAMSAEILHLVNSAFFGLAQELTDISQAVMFLGVEVIRSVVFIIGIKNEIPFEVSSAFSFGDFCKESVKLAAISKKLSEFYNMKRDEAEQLFALGILLNIGKIVQAICLQDEYSKFTALAESARSLDKEIDVFGAHHAQIGAYLLVLWGLPLNSAQIVAFHNDPISVDMSDRRFINCVYMAELICESPELVFNPSTELDPDSMAYLRSDEILELLEHVRADKDEYLGFV